MLKLYYFVTVEELQNVGNGRACRRAFEHQNARYGRRLHGVHERIVDIQKCLATAAAA